MSLLVVGLCPGLISVQDRLQSTGSVPSALLPQATSLLYLHPINPGSGHADVVNLNILYDISMDDILLTLEFSGRILCRILMCLLYCLRMEVRLLCCSY